MKKGPAEKKLTEIQSENRPLNGSDLGYNSSDSHGIFAK